MRSSGRMQMKLNCFDNHLLKHSLKIVVHNVQSLMKSIMKYIRSDFGFMLRAEILIFQEAWLKSTDQIELENFEVLKRNDQKSDKRTPFGSVIYVREDLANIFHVYQNIQIKNSSGSLQLTTIRSPRLFITSIYESPNFSDKLFKVVLLFILNYIIMISILIFNTIKNIENLGKNYF